MDENVWAIIVAGGSGTRMGLGYNKAFMPICGKPIITLTIEALATLNIFSGIVLVLGEGDIGMYQDIAAKYEFCSYVSEIAVGGFDRQASVRNGLKCIPEDADIVAIHDAARPFVSRQVVESVIKSAHLHGSGVAASQVTDTIKQVDDGDTVIKTLVRSKLRAVQTPQAFRRNILLKAHWAAEEAKFRATDDAALVEWLGECVHLVECEDSHKNFKITTPEDIRRAKLEMQSNDQCNTFRVGTGYDVHKLVEGRLLILCGVLIPYEKGLLGHSDADVAIHALMDAMLGAAALGDIGKHFPDNDEKYHGASSIKLLLHVVDLLHEQDFRVGNVDITIVAERPKLSSFIPQMVEMIANTLSISKSYVNIKATTTEGLGFEGEGLGISAQAVVLLNINN